MPANNHLQWTELRKFGGLWSAELAAMPSNAAQIMSGCHPQPNGGLRAFYKVVDTIPGTDLNNGGTSDEMVGFEVKTLSSSTLSSAGSQPLFLAATIDVSGVNPVNDLQLFRWRDYGTPDTAWQRYTTAGAAWAGDGSAVYSPSTYPAAFARMDIGGKSQDFFLPAPIADNVDGGVYLIDPDDSATSKSNASNNARTLVVHQSRLVVGNRDEVRFSPPGSADFTATGSGFFIPNPGGWDGVIAGQYNEEAIPAWMLPIPPGDLIVCTRDGNIYNVQGDIADPTIRELTKTSSALPHLPANTPAGIFIIVPQRGIHLLSPDGTLSPVSLSLRPSIWNPDDVRPRDLGQLAYSSGFLFAPNNHTESGLTNGALVFDTDTGAWFTSTHSDDATITTPRFMRPVKLPGSAGVWIASDRTLAAGTETQDLLFHIRTGGGYSVATDERAATWEWRSAPLRDPLGHIVEVREVQLNVNARNAASTIAVRVQDHAGNGTTITRTLPSGVSVQSFLFRERDQALEVNIKAKSNDAAVEAPALEAARFGFRARQMA